MESIKLIHVGSAYLTGLSFFLRGILAITQSNILKYRFVKILPHIIDTILLISGITMMATWALWPSSNPWLLAKIIGLLLYIYFGLLMLRWGDSAKNRWLGFLGGLLLYLYIVGAALTKSILSLMNYI